jgi:hypothetical protein
MGKQWAKDCENLQMSSDFKAIIKVFLLNPEIIQTQIYFTSSLVLCGHFFYMNNN